MTQKLKKLFQTIWNLGLKELIVGTLLLLIAKLLVLATAVIGFVTIIISYKSKK